MCALQRSPALRSNRNFLCLLGGRGFSEFGDYFGELALSWLVYTATGSVLSLGATWIFYLVPRSVIRLWGGVYVDRFDKRTLMIVTETARGIIFGLFAIVVALGFASLPVVFAVSISIGLIGALFDIASQAIVPRLVEPSGLLAANSYLTATFQVDSVLGPAAAGVAIFAVGVATSLSIDSISFFVLVGALALMRLQEETKADPAARSWRSEFNEGWNYFKSKGELVWLGFLVGGVNFALGGFWYVYALVLAKDVLNSGSAGFGAMNSFAAVGILATSTYIGRRGIKRPRLAVITSMLGMGIFVALTGLAQNLPEALASIALFGAAIPLISVVQSTYYQQSVPKELTGRVFGFQQFFDYVTIPAGIVFAILLDSVSGAGVGIVASGILILLFGLAGISSRSLRNLMLTPKATSPLR